MRESERAVATVTQRLVPIHMYCRACVMCVVCVYQMTVSMYFSVCYVYLALFIFLIHVVSLVHVTIICVNFKLCESQMNARNLFLASACEVCLPLRPMSI